MRPQDAASRTQFCTFAKNAVARFPSLDDVVIWNEPNVSAFWRPQFNADGSSAAPAAYEALLAGCWDALHAFRSTINVIGPETLTGPPETALRFMAAASVSLAAALLVLRFA